MTEAMPMPMPSVVSKARNLLEVSESNALRIFSMSGFRLFIAECLNGAKGRCTRGRIQSEENTNRRADARCQQNRGQRDRYRETWNGLADTECRQAPKKYADSTAADRKHNAFDQELPHQVTAACAKRLAQSDLAGALGHRHQHDVHDADAANQ